MTTAALGAPPADPGWVADASTFGARLALVRQRMGWGNIAKAAKECGVPTDSWRNWEVDGSEPRRLVTIAQTIATRTGCDLLWLVHGPARGGVKATREWRSGARVLRQLPIPDASWNALPPSTISTTRSVQQTRPARQLALASA
jgi:hypothetical protein